MSLVSSFIVAGGAVMKYQRFDASGTFTPSSALLANGGVVMLRMAGGGGGGAGANAGFIAFSGQGGSSSYWEGFSTVSGATTVTIGAGGTGATIPSGYLNTTGGTGGTTSFGSVSVAGGGGATGIYGKVGQPGGYGRTPVRVTEFGNSTRGGAGASGAAGTASTSNTGAGGSGATGTGAGSAGSAGFVEVYWME